MPNMSQNTAALNLSNIDIIAIEPQHPGNIGAICRACKNMGISQVVLVNPGPYDVAETYKLGWGSEDIIRNIIVLPTFAALFERYHILIGTTNRKKENQVPLYTPDELIPIITPASISHKIGIVLGRENNGLNLEELAACHYQSTIPSAVPYPALNLSQAALIYAQTCFKAATTTKEPVYTWDLANKYEEERMYAHIAEAVSLLPFKTRKGTDSFVRLFRRVLGRTQLEKRDVRVIFKLFDLVKRVAGDSRN
jgi:tRNA (cytidine32/uridine32-2'-O)-methyltransferase